MKAELVPVPPETHKDFAGIKVSPVRMGELMGFLRTTLDAGGRLAVTYVNPDYARQALRHGDLRRAINSFDLVLVDGNGLRLVTPLFLFVTPERLDTDAVAPALFRILADRCGSIFLFGCAPGVAARAATNLQHAFTGLRVVGTEHGYHDVNRGHPGRMDPADTKRIVTAINASAADVLLVSLPTPLQQTWVMANASSLATPVIMTAGSYLDHVRVTGGELTPWYPSWVERSRLHWLFRLMQEPRRLWRRYSIEYLDFLRLILRFRLNRRLRASA